MAKLHFFDGEKGGVGKSFVCRTAIEYLLDKNIPFIPVDADRYHSDVSDRYPELEFEFAAFSDDDEQCQADEIRDYAIDKPVLVSLPAQVGVPLHDWLSVAIEDAANYGVSFVRWFVSNGCDESLGLFELALEEHGKHMPHVLVKNQGLWLNGSKLEKRGSLQSLMKECQVQVMNFPKLRSPASHAVENSEWTFAQCRELAPTTMHRTRVNQFLRQAYAAFDSTGLMP